MSATLAVVQDTQPAPPRAQTKGSDLFVRALEDEGVDYVFGVPGEENLDLLESLRTSSIRLVVTRHEQTAGFMAATYGRLTGRSGVCLSTVGPGAANLVTAAAYASLGGTAIFSRDIQAALFAARHFAASAVMINDHTAFRTDWMPFAGYKQSGLGTGGIPYTMQELLQDKMVVLHDAGFY